MNRKKVLFVCTQNSARSQMAEGFLRSLKGGFYEAFSAGTAPSTVNPLAVEVMKEIGVDISAHRSKSVGELGNVRFDIVVTVCDRARGNCPLPPAAGLVLHRSFEDSAALNGAEAIAAFRRVRDEILKWIERAF